MDTRWGRTEPGQNPTFLQLVVHHALEPLQGQATKEREEGHDERPRHHCGARGVGGGRSSCLAASDGTGGVGYSEACRQRPSGRVDNQRPASTSAMPRTEPVAKTRGRLCHGAPAHIVYVVRRFSWCASDEDVGACFAAHQQLGTTGWASGSIHCNHHQACPRPTARTR